MIQVHGIYLELVLMYIQPGIETIPFHVDNWSTKQNIGVQRNLER